MALAMVGEALISASVEILLDRITSNEFRDFFANRKLNVSLLDELKIKLLALNAVLNDAEEKQITDPAVKEWLDELKDAVLDAEDLLDEINTESIRCKVEGDSQNFTSQVRSFLSSPFNQFYRSMNSKLEAISGRLQHFVNHIAILNLQNVTRRVSFGRKTDSLVDSVVVARRDEQEKLLSMLLSDDGDTNSNKIGVVTISGMGGLGKTTLAQVLYNNTKVQKHFDLKAWAWVSDDFDVFRVTKNLLESITKQTCDSTNLDNLRVELRNKLEDKRFLLVLDDLWNENYNDWHNLITPFSGGKVGSRIIVTTRQPRVAQITHSFPICELETLTEGNCWSILAKHAFGNEGYVKYPILEKIGRKIARKCGGLPLAAKTMGGLLRSNVDPEEWNRILNSNLWAHEDVLPALRLSYLHLPAHLKRCFAYCSIFQKQRLLDRKEMILLWMAEGFLQQSHVEKIMELAGEDCFNELISRYLIQKDQAVAAEKFRMHDLIYDLARLVSGKSCCCFKGGEIPQNVRHLTFLSKRLNDSKKFEGFDKLKCLRTFLPRNPTVDHCITKKVSHDLLPTLSCLRALSLSHYTNISELPDSIGSVVHLRYLNLSYTSIKCLPDSIFKLYNLQTLILSNCEFITHLPGKIGNLVSLRHLDLSGTNLVEMSAQICRLQELRTLTAFVIGRQEDGLSIVELSNFPYLQGKLSIQQLQNVVDPMDAVQANLMNKGQIEELTLQWGSDPEDSQIEKDVLENLQPSISLKELCIRYYGGTSFPNWVGDSSFSNIVVLRISNCNYCLSLPPFGQLPSLKKLYIVKMGMVKTIGHEFYSSNGSFSPIFQPFPSLESLEFVHMPEWQEWLPYEDLSDIGGNFAFPCLRRLRLLYCPKLRGSLPNCLPSLRYADIKECKQLEETKTTYLQWETSMEKLIVNKCDKLLPSLCRMIVGANCLQLLKLYNISSNISFPDDGLPTSLQTLSITNCVELQFLSLETLHKYTSLQSLTIINSCRSMSSFPFGCFPALQRLQIRLCPTLEAIFTQPGGAAPNLFLFCVSSCRKLKSLPEQIDLPALKYLTLYELGELASFPPIYLSSKIKGLAVDFVVLSLMFKLESGFPFQRFTSLSWLVLYGFGDEELVNTLPKKPSLPTPLEHLTLHKFRGSRFLEGGQGLQYITSLKCLYMFDCPKLESLPEDQLPSSLELLSIEKCPLLEARYQSQKGEHWSKIARIPAIKINEEVIIK